MKWPWYSLLPVVVLLASCSPQYTYFTESLYEKQGWTQEDIRRIQFYVSKDIILTRTLNAGETTIAEGKIRIKNGQRIEQVVIPTGTPGVLVLMPKENRFAISFEQDDDAYLMFGPNPKYFDRFALLAQDWDKSSGKVHYRDQVYKVTSESAFASLMVDLKRVGDSQYARRTVSGRKVGQ